MNALDEIEKDTELLHNNQDAVDSYNSLIKSVPHTRTKSRDFYSQSLAYR